jgi:hypothetical protein
VPAIVVVAVADRGEALVAVVTLVRLFASVNPHVHKQVASFVEGFFAPHAAEARSVRVAYIHHDVVSSSCLSLRLFVLFLRILGLRSLSKDGVLTLWFDILVFYRALNR